MNVGIIPAAGFSRRSFGKALAGLGVAAVAGCTTGTTGTTTEVDLNVSEATTDVTTALNIAKTVLAFTGLPAAVVTGATTAINLIETGLAALNTYTDGKIVLTYDKESMPSAITSVIANIQTAAGDLSAVAQSEEAALGASLTAKITAVASDVSSIGSILAAAASTVAASVSLSSSTSLSTRAARDARIAALKSKYGV